MDLLPVNLSMCQLPVDSYKTVSSSGLSLSNSTIWACSEPRCSQSPQLQPLKPAPVTWKTKQLCSKSKVGYLFLKMICQSLFTFHVFQKLFKPIWLSYSSPSQIFFPSWGSRLRTVYFSFAVPSLLWGMLFVGNSNPCWFVPHNSLLKPFWLTPLITTPSLLLIFSLQQLSKSSPKTSPGSQWRHLSTKLVQKLGINVWFLTPLVFV